MGAYAKTDVIDQGGGGRTGAGDENRTHVASLEGWSFTIKLRPLNRTTILPLVGAEPLKDPKDGPSASVWPFVMPCPALYGPAQ